MISPSSGANVTDIASVLSGHGPNDDRVKIPGLLLSAGTTYMFQLGVANFLSPSAYENVTHTVTKATDPVPALTLSSRIDLQTGQVFASEQLAIRAKAIVSLHIVYFASSIT